MADDDRALKIADENKLIRRLRFLVDLTFATIAQDNDLTLDQAWEHVLALKGAAVAMFPGKEDTFDLSLPAALLPSAPGALRRELIRAPR